MSDLNMETNLRGDDVVPLWRLPMDQKEFSSWSGSFDDLGEGVAGNEFSSLLDAEVAGEALAPNAQQDADIFDVAYKKGWEDGQAALAEEQGGNAKAAEALLTALRGLNDLYSEGSFEFILASIESLFRRCAELAVPDKELLQSWATRLAEMIDQDQKGACLILHPDDAELIDKELCKLPLRADDTMLRGNVKLSHSGGWIEKGSEVALDELRMLIDEFHNEPADGGS